MRMLWWRPRPLIRISIDSRWLNRNANKQRERLPPMKFDPILDRYRLSLWQSILCNRVANQPIHTHSAHTTNYTYHLIDLRRQHVMVAGIAMKFVNLNSEELSPSLIELIRMNIGFQNYYRRFPEITLFPFFFWCDIQEIDYIVKNNKSIDFHLRILLFSHAEI